VKLKPVRGFFAAGMLVALVLLPVALGAQAKAGAGAATGSGAVTGGAAAAGLMAAYTPPVSGDYAVYRDYSWEKPTWIGFLYYDDSTYGAVAVTPSTGANVSVLFRVENVDGKLVLTGQNIISKITQNDVITVNYLMSLLPDLHAWRQAAAAGSAPAGVSQVKAGAAPAQPEAGMPARSPLLPPMVVQSLNKIEFGGDVTLRYVPEAPVFNLQAMTGAAGKPVLELARMGRIRSGEDATFFGFTPTPDLSILKKGTPFALDPKRKAESKTVDGVVLKLDGQWTMVADNTLFLADEAALIVDTIDLAAAGLSAENSSQANLPLTMVTLFSLSSKTSWSVPSALAFSGTAKRFRIENLFYDSETGRANRDIKICIPLANGKCTVISLSVSDVSYQANKAYFEELF